MKWYLDLDDTLFQTTLGYSEVCRAVSKLYKIKLMTFAIRMLRMRAKPTKGGSERGYLRLFHTLRSFGIDPDEAAPVIKQELERYDFLFPDAAVLLDWLENQGVRPVILTFGDPETQVFKMSLVPRLAEFEHVVVQEPKQQYLKKMTKHDAILVDDKPIQDLPDWCRGVLIQRKIRVAPPNTRVITKLTELIHE
ncbi:MAG TPA: HAD family hydrolase [Candidatus Saccharimonadales bacterium]|nr:HAD family hydrolase [Candidatus Saccharimonadales bacterium]